MSSPLNEEFDRPQGTWDHYDAYDPSVREIIRAQKHVDIRDFNSTDRAAPLSVLDLSRVPMVDAEGIFQFDGNQVDLFDDPLHTLVAGEHWTVGTTTSLAS